MTTRYVYADITKVSSATDNATLPNSWWGTFDTGSTSQELFGAPAIGVSSVAAYVDDDIVTPTDNDYWFTPNYDLTSGLFKLTFEAIAISPSSIDLVIRHAQTTDMTMKNAYLFYDSANNPTMPTARYYFASGYLTPYTFSSGVGFSNTTLALTKTNDSNCDNYLLAGIPELEFELEKISSFEINEIDPTHHKISSVTLFASGTGTTAISSGIVPLYIGGAISSNSQFDLYMSGIGYTSGVVPLFIIGHSSLTSSTPDLFINGHSPSSGTIDLYMSGYPGFNSGIVPLYLLSFLPSSGTTELYTFGVGSGTATMPLYLGAAETTSSSGSMIPLSIWSTTNSGVFAQVPLTLNVGVVPNENMLYLSMTGGGYLGRASGIMNLVLSSTTLVSSGLSLVMWNSATASSGYFSLYITTPSGTEGAVPSSGTFPLYMNREFNSIAEIIPLSILGPILTSGVLPMYITGGDKMSSGNMDLFITAYGVNTATTRLYTHGF